MRAPLHDEHPPHVVRAPAGGARGRGLSGGRGRLRPLLRGRRTRPLALPSGREAVAVAVATSVPEVRTLGRDDVEVVPRHPVGAGASGTGQGADRTLNWEDKNEIRSQLRCFVCDRSTHKAALQKTTRWL